MRAHKADGSYGMAFNRLILYHEFVDSVYRHTKSDVHNPISRRQHVLAACEYFLATTMRKYCDHKGREKHTKTTGRIVQELGRVYRKRSPDKMSLIKAAVLFNASLGRRPSNRNNVEEDLRSLWSHVLALSDAADRKADLLKQSRHVKEELGELRKMVRDELSRFSKGTGEIYKLQKIEQVEKLQSRVTAAYSAMMKGIMDFCVKVKGEPPCAYTLVGMGSFAKKEITPFSDFENLIVLEEGVQYRDNYSATLEYFRWTAVMFQVVLICMGETILPFADIYALRGWLYDAFTTCGVSPDGFAPQASKNPLGRQEATAAKPWTTELIKPVSEMLKYTKPIHDMKNGYHLADMLSKTCFVAGDKKVYDDFADGVRLNLVPTECFAKRVADDLTRFSVTSQLPLVQNQAQTDVKRAVFRITTLFISALGRLHVILCASSFQITRKLCEMNKISESFMWDVLFALSLACEARLKVYSDSNAQADRMTNRNQENGSVISALVGEENAVAYFETAWKLQRLVSESIGNEQSIEMNPAMARLWIRYSLNQWSRTLEECRTLKMLDREPNAMDTKEALLVAMCYQKLKCHKEAIDYFQAVERKLLESEYLSDLLLSQVEISNCLMSLGRMADAFTYLERWCATYDKFTKGKAKNPLMDDVRLLSRDMVRRPELDVRLEDHYVIARRLRFSGNACRSRDENVLALVFYSRELALRKQLTADPLHDKKIAKCYLYMGQCKLHMGLLDEAEELLTKAESIYEINTFPVGKNMTLHLHLGEIAFRRKKYDRAVAQYTRQVELELQREEVNNSLVGTCYDSIAVVHIHERRYDAALKCLCKARGFYVKTNNEVLREANLERSDRWMTEVILRKRELGQDNKLVT